MADNGASALSACTGCGAHIPRGASTCPVCALPALAATLPPFSDVFLGTYEILDVLGKGGMGTVLKVRHRRLDRLVCVKLVNLVDPEMQARFLQEGRLLAKIDNERIIRVFDSAVDQGLIPYLVCEYVEGRSLRDVLDRDGLLPLERSLELVIQILEGLEAAHADHVIHRDIKPDNILITSAGRVKIADFGLARSTKTDMRRTSSGVMIGTPSYMAPEQITGQEISPATDLYATGVLLFELLIGKPPYDGRVPLEVLNQHVSGMIPRVSAVRPELNLPRALDRVLEMALAKDPTHRYESAQAFREDLAKVHGGLDAADVPTGVHAPDEDAPPKPRRTGTVAVARPGAELFSTSRMPRPGHGARRMHAMLALLAVGCLFGASFLRPTGKPGPRPATEAQVLIDKACDLVRERKAKDADGRTVDDLVGRARRIEPAVDVGPVCEAYLARAVDLRSDGRIAAARPFLEQLLRLDPTHPKAAVELELIRSELTKREGKVLPIVQGPPTRHIGDRFRVVVYAGVEGYLALYLIEPGGLRQRLIPDQLVPPRVSAGSEVLWPPPDTPGVFLYDAAGDHLLYAVVFAAEHQLQSELTAKFKDQPVARDVFEHWLTSLGPAVKAWTPVSFKVWPREPKP